MSRRKCCKKSVEKIRDYPQPCEPVDALTAHLPIAAPTSHGSLLPIFPRPPADPRRHSATHNTQVPLFFSLLLSRVVEVLLLTFFFNVRKIDFHIQFSNIVSEKESYKSLSHTSILFKASRKIEYGNFQT
jgi:hypothetical protein